MDLIQLPPSHTTQPQPQSLPQSKSPPAVTPSPHTPAFDLPRLPDELWLLILRETTAIRPCPLRSPSTLTFLESTSAPCELADYHTSQQRKLTLSLVSKEWNRLAQDQLYEFVWLHRAGQAKALARTLLMQRIVDGKVPSGMYIRRLHMETKVLERCAVEDIRTILDYAPNLVMYSDHHSVRRHRYDEAPNPRCSPEQMFETLHHPENKLKHISWTNYADDSPFPFHISPVLQRTSSSLEYLELSSSNFDFDPGEDLDRLPSMVVTLPALRSLKVTLDNVTFAVLSTWEMPLLVNLSVVSADFSYAGRGFARFFASHGDRLRQLELGHSSSLVEEHYLPTSSPRAPIPLAEWCPNLVEFICSADADWNWQTPDWIAPHILLPTHPHLRFIGIRDIDRRLQFDAVGPLATDTRNDAPYFPLVEQLSSLLRKDAFPKLQFIRDLSRESHAMRNSVPVEGRVIKFWGRVLERCREREVWLEDWTGVNVTQRDLLRVGQALAPA
jgi:hypothetical protein